MERLRLEDVTETVWDRYVASHPQGTLFHRSVWRRIVERCFGHRPHYLAVAEDGVLRGVLPLFEIRSRLFGHSLVSVPLGVYGGICADTADAERVLLEAARDLARRLDVDYVELRHTQANGFGLPTKDLYVTFKRALDPEVERNFLAIPRKARRMIRLGMRNGLTAAFENDAVDTFYDIYAESVRNLGTPVFPRAYFRSLRDALGEACRILLVRRNGEAVAGVMTFYDRGAVMPYYGGAKRWAFRYAVNDYMYWELMKRGCEEGYRWFDFGRSKKNSGSFHFKRHWGFVPVDLPYQYILGRSRTVPDVSPNNPRYRLFIGIWKRLPLRVTQWLGPKIARNIP